MKKEALVICSAILFLLILINFNLAVTGEAITTGAITGESVTGKASNQQTNVSIQVIALVPSLAIITPVNGTYLTNTSILLNFTSINAVEHWYNLDDAENTTITSASLFNATEESHTLWLYANSSNSGTASENVTFAVNSTKLIIANSKLEEEELEETGRNATKGATTDFLSYSYEELEALDNVILEEPSYGKILFTEAINMPADANDNILDLDSNINFSFNKIELNSTALPNFNKSATLTLYNLTFTTPRILIDGEICPDSICTQNSYSSGILSFNVTHFSIYSAEETPVSASPPGGGGGGGGGGGEGAEITPALKFSVTPDLIKVILKKGESFTRTIKIKNENNIAQKFKIETTLKELAVPEEKGFTLEPGEEKSVSVVFYAPERTEPDTYTGKIKISNPLGYKEISVIINIKSKLMLFDITLRLLPEYKETKPGQELLFETTLFNLGETEKIHAKKYYYIRDFDSNVIVEKEGEAEVETQATFLESLTLPKNISEGQYIVGINAVYAESIGTASDTFYVGEKIKIKPVYVLIAGLVVLVLIILIILLFRHYNQKLKTMIIAHTEELNKIENKIKKGNLEADEARKMKNKLDSQLSLIYKAYSKGYIKKEAYERSRERIMEASEKIKKRYL